MTWSMVPPAMSPVSLDGFPGAFAAAVGLGAAPRIALEKTLCARFGMSAALLTDSGTSALVLALNAVTQPGDTVALPSYACIDLTTAALGAGVHVRLYDLDPGTLSPDLDSVRAAVGRGVDAIVVAHLFGYPADIDGVGKIAADYGIPVIEDSAQGAGGTLHSRRLGGLADISVLSFGRGKGTTAGSGGALMVKSSHLVEKLNALGRSLGPTPEGGKELLTLAAQLTFSHPRLYRFPASMPGLRLGEMVYHPPRQPRRMSETAMALLPSALQVEPVEIESRKSRARIFLARAGSYKHSKPVRPITGGESGYLRMAMLRDKGDFTPPVALGSAAGYPLTLDQHVQLQPILRPGERAGTGAARLRDRLYTLPTHSQVRARDVARLVAWLGAQETARDVLLRPVGAW